MNIDWRDRFGWPWTSSIRNQEGSQNCWAFAMASLYADDLQGLGPSSTIA